MTKPRPDAKLLNLPEERQAQLAEWLLSGIPYHQVKEMVLQQFTVTTSLGALSNFYQTVCASELVARRRRAVSTADEVAIEAEKAPGRFDTATIDALKQKAFELAINPGADPRDVKNLFGLVLKARDQELDEKQLELDREKFREQIRTAVERGLDALQREAEGNAEALQYFQQFKTAIMKNVTEACAA